jgi:hypothetical protein
LAASVWVNAGGHIVNQHFGGLVKYWRKMSQEMKKELNAMNHRAEEWIVIHPALHCWKAVFSVLRVNLTAAQHVADAIKNAPTLHSVI